MNRQINIWANRINKNLFAMCHVHYWRFEEFMRFEYVSNGKNIHVSFGFIFFFSFRVSIGVCVCVLFFYIFFFLFKWQFILWMVHRTMCYLFSLLLFCFFFFSWFVWFYFTVCNTAHPPPLSLPLPHPTIWFLFFLYS